MTLIKKLNIDWKSIGLDKWLLMALAGVLLIICSIPSSKDNSEKEKEETASLQNTQSITGSEYAEYMEKRLEKMLGNISGIGKVEVMITLKSSSQKVILMEEPYTKNTTKEEDSQGGKRSEDEISKEQKVIYIKDSSGNETPYVIQEREPEIEGIAIAAQGGGDKVKAAEITSVAEALFSVSAHKISVIEMNE